MSRTAQSVAARKEQLVPMLRSADATLAAIDADAGRPLDDSLAALPGTLESADRGGRALEGLVARLDPLSAELRPGLRALGPTLTRLQPLVRRAGPALRRARPLISDARGLLTAGSAAAPDTKRLLAALDPSLKLLDESLLPALHAPTAELDIPAYVSFLNLFGGGGGASRPFQTGAPGSSGHFMRFGLRFITGVGAPLPPCSAIAAINPALAAALSAAGGCTP
jgi:phospholipid/cholesterol/gamma-HCH transport system substrate-binding protein